MILLYLSVLKSVKIGKDCLVIINNDTILFRKLLINEAGIILQPLNDKDFEPVFYSNKQIEELDIQFIGIPKELIRKID